MKHVKLLPKSALVKTGRFDHADWNYIPVFRYLQRKRFFLILELLGNQNFDRVLEIGYGSGIFMPQLAKRCKMLHGIDIHQKHVEVQQTLKSVGVHANLLSGTVEDLPYASGMFDAIVSVSTLEYVPDIGAACTEMSRVLRSDGILCFVTPNESKLLDAGLRILTSERASDNYGDNRRRLLVTVGRIFDTERILTFPSPAFPLCAYKAIRATKR